MSILNCLRHSFKVLTDSRRMIYRCQSQQLLDLLNRKALELSPIANTIEWNKKLKYYRIRAEGQKALKLFEIGVRKYQFQPDYITYVSLIEMCKEIKDLENGRYVHRLVHGSSVKENSRIQGALMVHTIRMFTCEFHSKNEQLESYFLFSIVFRRCTLNVVMSTVLDMYSNN
jgi:hypothetical protein